MHGKYFSDAVRVEVLNGRIEIDAAWYASSHLREHEGKTVLVKKLSESTVFVYDRSGKPICYANDSALFAALGDHPLNSFL